MDIVISFSETQMRPQIGDYVLIYYIRKKLKDGRIIRKMLHIDYSDSCDLQLKKSISGFIRLNYNHKGQLKTKNLLLELSFYKAGHYTLHRALLQQY